MTTQHPSHLQDMKNGDLLLVLGTSLKVKLWSYMFCVAICIATITVVVRAISNLSSIVFIFLFCTLISFAGHSRVHFACGGVTVLSPSALQPRACPRADKRC